MLEKRTVSQCISSDYCRGWNDAVENANFELAGMRGAAESYKIHYDKAQEKIKALKEALDGETVQNMRLEHEVERLKWDLAFREKQLDNLVKEMEGADK